MSETNSIAVELVTMLTVHNLIDGKEILLDIFAYLMSTITNQNTSNNGQNGTRHNNGNGKFPNTKTQRPRKFKKIWFVGDVEVWDMG